MTRVRAVELSTWNSSPRFRICSALECDPGLMCIRLRNAVSFSFFFHFSFFVGMIQYGIAENGGWLLVELVVLCALKCSVYR